MHVWSDFETPWNLGLRIDKDAGIPGVSISLHASGLLYSTLPLLFVGMTQAKDVLLLEEG